MFDLQVLFDPFKKQFNFPATFIQGGDLDRRQIHIVGEKYQVLTSIFVEVANASKFARIMFSGKFGF